MLGRVYRASGYAYEVCVIFCLSGVYDCYFLLLIVQALVTLPKREEAALRIVHACHNLEGTGGLRGVLRFRNRLGFRARGSGYWERGA